MAELPQMMRAFGVTFLSMFRKVTTEQYPEVKVPTQERFHGKHQLNRHPDSNEEGDRFSPGERYGRVYQINYLRCIGCGLCIEACPTRALTMTNEYELADNSRTKLIYEKEDLLAPIQPGMVQPPHSMIDDFVAQDYYDGKVTGASAEQFAEVELIKQKNQGI